MDSEYAIGGPWNADNPPSNYLLTSDRGSLTAGVLTEAIAVYIALTQEPIERQIRADAWMEGAPGLPVVP